MPRWLDTLRETVLFLLGVAVLVDAIVSPGTNTIYVIAGLVLLGLIPLDRFLTGRAEGG